MFCLLHRTYKNLKKPSPLTEEQKYKFAEYLLTRRSVNTPKGACLLIEAANALADDEVKQEKLFTTCIHSVGR